MNRRRIALIIGNIYAFLLKLDMVPQWLRLKPITRVSPRTTSYLIFLIRALSPWIAALPYLTMGLGMVGLFFTAMAGYSGMNRASNSDGDGDSEPPSYSVLRHIAQFLPGAALTLGGAAALQEKAPPGKFLLGVLRTLGTVSPYVALLIVVGLVPFAITWLLIKKLHLEPYKRIWYLTTTVAPRLILYPFFGLLLIESICLFRPPLFTLFWFLTEFAFPVALGFKWLGIRLYVAVAVWRVTDATAAYFFTRGARNLNFPPGFIPWPRDSFIPESPTRFFLRPLLLPAAMILNGCLYTTSTSRSPIKVRLISAAVVIGSITLAVFAVGVYVLSVYGFLDW
ncbi:hypothetical protein K438DRAFT_1753139 [Mycena galopus ATCC 62051]|nr:hypothetical protein K438DRAFT_1753139 [Mycena galopus ATCC 62051]